MNWKYGIIILCSGFVLMISTMAYKASKKSMDLVAEDYYDKEIKYQDQISKLKNSSDVSKDFAIKEEGDNVVITFPNGTNALGTITFFRPSDKKLDKSFALSLNDRFEQIIPKKDLAKGRYQISVDWNEANKAYYVKKDLYLQ